MSSSNSLKQVLPVLACIATSVGIATSDGHAQDGGVTVLSPVIIIGERRAESIVDVTTSVSVYSEEDLERAPGADINDVIRSAPNVHTRSISELPNIRGIEGGGPGGLANTALGGSLPRVPLIVDEIARPASVPNSDFTSLWDVEQLEVLKGPQTTLRGRSAIGGAIVVKTKDPTFKPEMAAQTVTELDDFHGVTQTFNAMASFGVVKDLLAVRATFESRFGEDPREVVNVPAGRDGDLLNEFDQRRIRGKVLLTPQGESGPLTLLGIVDYQEGVTPQTRGTVQRIGFTDGRIADFSDRQIDFTTGGLRIFDTEALTTALDATYKFQGSAKLRSITSNSQTDFKSLPEQPQNFFFDFEEEVFNQDVLLTFGSDDTRVGGLIGATYTHRTQTVQIDNIIPPFVPQGVALLTTKGESETLSAFADLRIGLTEKLDLLPGGRVLRHEFSRATASNLLSIPPFFVPPAQVDVDEEESVVLPAIALRYAVTDESSVSIGARKGWNEGGAAVNFFTGQPYSFESEEVWSYEAAYRFQSKDNRFTFAATGFYNVYDNPQFFLETQPGNRFSIQVVNLPEGETYGAEFEGRAAVTKSLTLFGGLGLLETEITQSTAANPQLQGNRFGKDPDVTATAGFVWKPASVPYVSVDGKATFVGESFNDFDNVQDEIIGGYTLVDLGVGYERDGLKARLFVNNLFDETGLTTRVGDFAAVTPPRTGGFSLTARF